MRTVVWRESVVVGETDLSAQEVQEVVQAMGAEYRGNAYHLLERNCNHFSDELCYKLTGRHPPPWVRRPLLLCCLCIPARDTSQQTRSVDTYTQI